MKTQTNNDPISNIIISQAMKRNNIKPYGVVSKYKKGLGKGCIVVGLLPCFTSPLIVVGLYLLGLPLRLMVKSKMIDIKQRVRLI